MEKREFATWVVSLSFPVLFCVKIEVEDALKSSKINNNNALLDYF